ncbi:uncharacterized protein MYCFIDRAFT_208995, partial [Pseudocercospora fijiensis CIRAD86]
MSIRSFHCSLSLKSQFPIASHQELHLSQHASKRRAGRAASADLQAGRHGAWGMQTFCILSCSLWHHFLHNPSKFRCRSWYKLCVSLVGYIDQPPISAPRLQPHRLGPLKKTSRPLGHTVPPLLNLLRESSDVMCMRFADVMRGWL